MLLFLLIGLVVLLIYVQMQRRLARDGGAFDGRGGNLATPPPVSLDGLRARDPALTEESIADHVRQMADILREAWCAGDMRPARPFVSDGVCSRFQVQLGLMRQENRRNVMGDARVLAVTLEAVEAASPLEVVHVRIVAEARDTEVPLAATEEQIRHQLARTSVESYGEIWSLVRRTGAQTRPPEFAVGRACPSCGAPLDGGETIKCRYCGTLVCSGEHDWVLAEITQLEEWRPTTPRDTGVERLRQRDPGVAIEVLEDRASYVFWKWVQAGRAGQVAALRKCASPALLGGDPARIDLIATAGAWDVAVGGANLAMCEANGPDGYDRAFVEIFWSARFGPSAPSTPARAMMRLARRSGVVSQPSMTALVCQACGAPLSEGGLESDSSRCDHCGVELAAGDQAWVLDAVLRPQAGS
jgi:DNA-directed RNA polymerase subunit RPC12/RpoP